MFLALASHLRLETITMATSSQVTNVHLRTIFSMGPKYRTDKYKPNHLLVLEVQKALSKYLEYLRDRGFDANIGKNGSRIS